MDGITPENANDYIKTYSILLTQIEKVTQVLVHVVLTNPPFVNWQVLFTRVLFKPLSDYGLN